MATVVWIIGASYLKGVHAIEMNVLFFGIVLLWCIAYDIFKKNI